IPRDIDYNAESQTGTGYYQRWIANGWRVSAARAFLQPAMGRSNLDVRTNAHATRIVLEGNRAVGIDYARGAGAPSRQVRARREVILCAGAANTPKLMQISGIGPAALLQALGVAIHRDLPGVGRNLRDHYMLRSIVQVKGVQTLNSTARGLRLLGEIAKWALKRPSVLGISPSVAFAFCKSDEALATPDLQFHFSAGSYTAGIAGMLDKFPGMTLGFYQLRPVSAGHVSARTPNPFDDPVIQPNYLADEADQRVVVEGVRLSRRFLRTAALLRYHERDVSPPASATSDRELLDFARGNAGTAWHLMGTCRMGPASQPDSVVDPALRVIGLQGLRVADASIMPTMPSGNTGAPTMMIAEKAADLIRNRAPLKEPAP
ncbi:MAG: GMC oxidoreductase, partial [Betaproteobacteria bacterium]